MSDLNSIKQKALDKLETQLEDTNAHIAREAAREILGYDIALRHATQFHPFIGEPVDGFGTMNVGQDVKDPDGIQGS